MAGTHMVLVWPNDDGTVTLSQRYGRGHYEPQVVDNPPRVASIIEPVATSVGPFSISKNGVLRSKFKLIQWNIPRSTRMAFNIPANKTALAEDPVEHLIWAYSMTRPKESNDAELLGHYRAGFLRVNFSKEAIPPPPPFDKQTPLPHQGDDSVNMDNHHHTSPGDTATFESTVTASGPWGNHEKLIAAHGILLVTGFLVLLPTGSLIARWTRTISPKWFKVHSFINMSIAMPIIIIGWLLGPMAVIDHQAGHLISTHQASYFTDCSRMTANKIVD